jgi:dynein heavy chain
MYQISLQQFLGLFHDSMIKSNKIAATQKRIQNINDYLTYRTWFYTTRGLYEEDRLMFTLLLALRIDLRRGKIRYDEFEVLIKGGASLDLNTCPSKPFRWLNDLSWLNLLELSRVKEFHDVIDRVNHSFLFFFYRLFISSYKRMNVHSKIGSINNQMIYHHYPKHMKI